MIIKNVLIYLFLSVFYCHAVGIKEIIKKNAIEHVTLATLNLITVYFDYNNREIPIDFFIYEKEGYFFAVPYVYYLSAYFRSSFEKHLLFNAENNKFFYDFAQANLILDYPDKFNIIKNKDFYLNKNRKDLIYRLENNDGTAWNTSLPSLSSLVDVSHKVISNCHGNKTRFYLRYFASF